MIALVVDGAARWIEQEMEEGILGAASRWQFDWGAGDA
jgi:hypothetical protein